MEAISRALGRLCEGKPWVVVALLAALGATLRLIQLGFQPLWFDEGYSFYFAGSSIPKLIADTAVDIHPPLYYLLLKGWLAVFGAGVIPARLLSAAIGTAAIPLLYLLGRRLAGQSTALWAAALLAISPFHIYYSQEVRMYGLVTLLTLLASLLTLRAIEGEPQVRWWIGAGLALAAALYTQYYAVFTPLALTIHMLLRRERLRLCARPWALTLAGVALAYLPWLIYATPRLVVYVQYKVGMDNDLPLSPLEFLRRVLVAYGAGHLEGWLAGHWWLGLLLPAITLGGLLLAAGMRRSGRRPLMPRGPRPLAFGLISLSIPLLGAYLINLLAPFNPPRSERLLLFGLPAFCLLAACVSAHIQTASLSRKWVSGALVALVAIGASATSLLAFYTTPRYAEDDYRPAAKEIEARSRPDDVIICVMPWQVGYFKAYLSQPMPALVETPGEIFPQARQFWADDRILMETDLNALLAAHGRLWTPAYLASGSPLEGNITTYLDTLGVRTLSLWYGTTHLSLHTPVPELTFSPARAEFAGRLAFSDVAWNAASVESAFGSIVLQSTWRKTDSFDQAYRMALRLADDRDRTWGQWDMEPAWGRRPFNQWGVGETQTERFGLLLDAGVPPGSYTLAISLRDASDGPLPITDPTASEPETEVKLGQINVTRPATPVDIDALRLDHEVSVEFNRQLRLLGYRLPERLFAPGEELPVTLYWRCLQAGDEELVTFVQALDADGALVAATEMPPTDGFFAVSRWQPGDVVRDRQALRLPASLPDGDYRLIAGMFRQADGQRLTVTGGARQSADFVTLGNVSVQGREHEMIAPAPDYPLHERFGDLAMLVGYDIVFDAAQNEMELTLYWQARQEIPLSYKVFVHAYDAESRRLAQHDSEPGQGRFPTSGWLPGEYIADSHTLIFEHARPAVETIWVGLYDPASGQRLPLLDAAGAPAGDHLELAPDAHIGR
jgi:hypothetical protein